MFALRRKKIFILHEEAQVIVCDISRFLGTNDSTSLGTPKQKARCIRQVHKAIQRVLKQNILEGVALTFLL